MQKNIKDIAMLSWMPEHNIHTTNKPLMKEKPLKQNRKLHMSCMHNRKNA